MISTNEVPISTKIAPELVPEFQKLNDNQQKAVAYDSGQLLVLAGPGSGKTHCLMQMPFIITEGITNASAGNRKLP